MSKCLSVSNLHQDGVSWVITANKSICDLQSLLHIWYFVRMSVAILQLTKGSIVCGGSTQVNKYLQKTIDPYSEMSICIRSKWRQEK